jgi:hypothetical protein
MSEGLDPRWLPDLADQKHRFGRKGNWIDYEGNPIEATHRLTDQRNGKVYLAPASIDGTCGYAVWEWNATAQEWQLVTNNCIGDCVPDPPNPAANLDADGTQIAKDCVPPSK